jgi:hypothetical protein
MRRKLAADVQTTLCSVRGSLQANPLTADARFRGLLNIITAKQTLRVYFARSRWLKCVLNV